MILVLFIVVVGSCYGLSLSGTRFQFGSSSHVEMLKLHEGRVYWRVRKRMNQSSLCQITYLHFVKLPIVVELLKLVCMKLQLGQIRPLEFDALRLSHTESRRFSMSQSRVAATQ